MKEILVIRLSAIGDILLTTPILARLKKNFPEAIIRFLVKEQYAEFIAASPDVDEILTWKKDESILSVRRALNAKGCKIDLLIDLQNNLKTRLLTILLRVGAKRRYHKPYFNRLLLVYFKKNRFKEKKKISERYAETLKDFDLVPLTERVTLKREMLPRPIARFMEAPAILIAPGARWATKRWPAEYFVSLASKILEKHTQQKIVWLGGPDETEIFEFLGQHPYLRRHTKRMLFLPNELSVGQMVTLADAAKVIVSNDSGLMHLLSAGHTPIIALFLSTVEEFGFYPLSDKAEVLAARDIPCRPCNHKGLAACPKNHFRCGRELTADQVYLTVAKYLVKSSAAQEPF